jgi:hypothetical protein
MVKGHNNIMGDSNMKKILSIIFSASLIFGMGTTAFADVKPKDANVEKAIDLISKTNEKIYEKIEKAVDEADKLKADYLADIRKINADTENELVDGTGDLKSVETEQVSVDDIQSILFTIEKELILESESTDEHLGIAGTSVEVGPNNVGDIFPTKDALLETLLGTSTNKKYKDRTVKYVEQLDKVISKVFNETKKMSDQTIEKVEKLGVQARCHWELHSFAGVEVWIDPIQIVGI